MSFSAVAWHAGLFMAQQEKVLACGPCFAALGLVLKFALGPAAMAIGSIAVGLRGDVLRVAIIQVPARSPLWISNLALEFKIAIYLAMARKKFAQKIGASNYNSGSHWNFLRSSY